MYDTIMLWLGKKDIGDEYNYENVLRKIYKTCTFEKVRGGMIRESPNGTTRYPEGISPHLVEELTQGTETS